MKQFEVHVDSIAYVQAESKEEAERKALNGREDAKDIVDASAKQEKQEEA